MNPKDTITRREFSQLMLAIMTLFTAASTGRAGIDTPAKAGLAKKLSGKLAEPQEIEGCKLFIDLPPSEAWNLDLHLHKDEWNQLLINPLDVSPRLELQLTAAKASEKDPILVRVLGDPKAVLLKPCIYGPGDKIFWSEEKPCDAWRIEYFDDGIRQIMPDNASWWTHRLEPIKGHPDWNAYERAFAEIWQNENERTWSSERGILQALMFSTYQHEKPPQF